MRTMTNGARRQRDTRPGASESGVALIMALLALLLLTAVGLTLATSTSTEVQVAANYRWSLQALYNAEAGIEVAKSTLAGVDWDDHPKARTPPWDPAAVSAPVAAPSVTDVETAARVGTVTRDFEMGRCDALGNGMGYGVIMPDLRGGTGTLNAALADVSTYGGQNLNGAFTLWYRKPRKYDKNGTVADFDKAAATDYGANVVIVVAEGVAPTSNTVLSGAATAGRAVQIVEATLYNPVPSMCEADLTGNPGGGAGGAGVNPCERAGGTIDTSRLGMAVSGGGGQVSRRSNY
jgi:Tfp pilus assembly protein PilX